MGIIVNYHLPESWKTQGIQFTKTPGSNSKSQKNPGRILGVQKPRICQSQAAHSSSTFILDHSQSQSITVTKNIQKQAKPRIFSLIQGPEPGYSRIFHLCRPLRPVSSKIPKITFVEAPGATHPLPAQIPTQKAPR